MVQSSRLGKVRLAIYCTETVLIVIRLSVVCARAGGRSRQSKWEDAGECFEDFEMLEVRENIDISSHLADIHLECDEAAADGSKLGLG